MECTKSKSVAREELLTLLNFLEIEKDHLEKEKNELKIKYHGRPPEERNILKDIITMHNEFEAYLSKLKEIAEAYAEVPVNKNKITRLTEKKIDLVAEMQEQLIEYYEKTQKLLIYKSMNQAEAEKLKILINTALSTKDSTLKAVNQIKIYDSNTVFIEKSDLLESECDRLTDLINKSYTEPNPTSIKIDDIHISSLSQEKAANELEKTKILNSELKKEIKYLEVGIERLKRVNELKIIKNTKQIENQKLESHYRSLQADIEALKKYENIQHDDLASKMSIIDQILRKKDIKFSSLAISSMKKNSLLEEIEASINRAKGIITPNK
jgi:hypothetical protein